MRERGKLLVHFPSVSSVNRLSSYSEECCVYEERSIICGRYRMHSILQSLFFNSSALKYFSYFFTYRDTNTSRSIEGLAQGENCEKSTDRVLLKEKCFFFLFYRKNKRILLLNICCKSQQRMYIFTLHTYTRTCMKNPRENFLSLLAPLRVFPRKIELIANHFFFLLFNFCFFFFHTSYIIHMPRYVCCLSRRKIVQHTFFCVTLK